MTEIPDGRYRELMLAQRIGCCSTWRKPCDRCDAYGAGLEAGYDEGHSDGFEMGYDAAVSGL